jgi:hypothetical protein
LGECPITKALQNLLKKLHKCAFVGLYRKIDLPYAQYGTRKVGATIIYSPHYRRIKHMTQSAVFDSLEQFVQKTPIEPADCPSGTSFHVTVFSRILGVTSNRIFDPRIQLLHSTDFTTKDLFLTVTPEAKLQG